eukprot:UC4_evm4s1268
MVEPQSRSIVILLAFAFILNETIITTSLESNAFTGEIESLFILSSSGDVGGLREVLRHVKTATTLERLVGPRDVDSYHGNSALHIAGNAGIVRELVEFGADPTLPNRDGYGDIPVNTAARLGRVSAVEELLRQSDTLLANAGGQTPLHSSVMLPPANYSDLDWKLFGQNYNQDEDVRARVIRLIITMTSARSHDGRDGAARYKNYINLRDKEGNSALHIASKNCFHIACKMLVKYGAVIGKPNVEGMTPVHAASVCRSSSVLDELLTLPGASDMLAVVDPSGMTPLVMVVKNPAILADNVRSLIQIMSTEAIRIHDNSGKAALHHIIERGSTVLLKIFLEYSSDVNFATKDGVSPLQLAVRLKNEKIRKRIIGLLSSNGATNSAGSYGSGTSHDAVLSGSLETLLMILDNSDHVNHVDADGNTPLHLASRLENAGMVEALVKQGASVKIKNKAGYLSVHETCKHEKGPDATIVRLLLQAGSNGSEPLPDGSTCLLRAVITESTEAARELINFGARPVSANYGDYGSLNPLHFVLFQNRIDVLELLLGEEADINTRIKSLTPFLSINSTEPAARLLLEACEHSFHYRQIVYGASYINSSGTTTSNFSCPDFVNGMTLIQLALKMGNVPFAKIVLQHRPRLISTARETPAREMLLFTAFRTMLDFVHTAESHTDRQNLDGIVSDLIRLGISPNVRGSEYAFGSMQEEGKHIFMFFLDFVNHDNQWEVSNFIDRLLEFPIIVDARDLENHETALMRAAELGMVDLVQALLRKRARPTLTARDGSTALKNAFMHGVCPGNSAFSTTSSVRLDYSLKFPSARGLCSCHESGAICLSADWQQNCFHVPNIHRTLHSHDGFGSGFLPSCPDCRCVPGGMISDCLNVSKGNYGIESTGENNTFTFMDLFGEFQRSGGKALNSCILDVLATFPEEGTHRDGPIDVVEEMMNALLDAGSDPDERFKNGDTFLHKAVLFDEPTIVQLLLGKGAKIDLANANSETPLDLALVKGNREGILELLDSKRDEL